MKHTQTDNLFWYVAKTKPRAERQVQSVLNGRGIGTYLPWLRRRQRSEPLFPGYIFLQLDRRSDGFLRSRAAPGISYILCADREPIVVVEDLIEEIRRRVDIENQLRPAERFKPGEKVVVRSGPFRDLEAVFDRALTPQGRCMVFLQIMGRLTRVQVDADCLAK
jgi:transcriptional antiterminator RfaH